MIGEHDFGPVVVRQPGRALRVGYFDNVEPLARRGFRAFVYYFPPPFLLVREYHMVNLAWLSPVDTPTLWSRRESLHRIMWEQISPMTARDRARIPYKRLYGYSQELSVVEGLLSDRMLEALRNEGVGRRVFISYSPADKQAAISLSVDLAGRGHRPWLDEWQIRAGETIPVKIAQEFLLVLLSPRSVESGWVEREWLAKYCAEVTEGRVTVIPVLLEQCRVPTLLRTKKYADLRSDYQAGLTEILEALAAYSVQSN